MLRICCVALLCSIYAVSSSAEEPSPPTIPPAARAMLDAAFQSQDLVQVSAVANAATIVYPDAADAISAYAQSLEDKLAPVVVVGDRDMAAKPEIPPVKTADQELAPAPPPKFLSLGDWTGKVSASGVVASGNSHNSAAGLDIEAKRPVGSYTHNISAYFDYGRSNGAETQQRWGAAYKLDVAFDERTFAYGRFSYDEDAFSGFDYRLFGGLGFGHWFAKSKEIAFKLEGGPGYQYAPIDNSHAVDSYAAFYGATEFDWLIRDGVKFEQDFNATWTTPTTTLVSKTTLSTAFTDTLSTGISFLYHYETNPPDARKNADTLLRLNLTYGF